MDLNPVRRKRERDIAQDVASEFMRNINSAETVPPPELLAHHFGRRARASSSGGDTNNGAIMSQHETYLGDGLYASWDGCWQVRLRYIRRAQKYP